MLKWSKIYIRQTQLSFILLMTSFGLWRPSSDQNNYKNLNIGVYNVLFVNVMGSHLQWYSSLQLISNCTISIVNSNTLTIDVQYLLNLL